MAAVAIVDEPITFDHFMRTVLALREQKTDCSEDELFATAWAFLKRARAQYGSFVNGTPLWEFEGAFIPPFRLLEDAARFITGKRNSEQALSELEKFMPDWAFRECQSRGKIGADFCVEYPEALSKMALSAIA